MLWQGARLADAAEIAGQLKIESAAVRASLKKARRRLAELMGERP
ncbi:hypothetical protein AB0K14_22580 [Actinosynnema sp. NPDC050801]